MKNKYLVPSLLSFNIKQWSYYFLIFQKANISYIHFDVMDSNYVGNTAYTEKEYKKFIHNYNSLKAHVHLMVMNPLVEVEKYFHTKTDAICFHYDVYKNKEDVFACLKKIKAAGIKAGIALNYINFIDDYKDYLPECDIITIMGVKPGKGGQSFNIQALQVLMDIKQWTKENNKDLLIEIDGGMNENTIPLVLKDSQFIVSGSYLANNLNKLPQIAEWMNELNSKL